MSKNLRFFLCLAVGVGFLLPNAQAQFVNFEDTWQEFLKNPKTSAVSKLVKPSKDQTENYLKFAMMYATKHFCADEIGDAEKYMGDIRAMGESKYGGIPMYKEKFVDLTVKIKAHHAVDVLWKRFLQKGNVTVDELEAIDKADKVCEKGTLAKYFHMTALDYYCNADVAKAKGHFEGRTLKLAEKTSLKVEDVEGLKPEVTKMKKVFNLHPPLNKAWAEFIDTDVSPGFEQDMPVIECYSIPNMKIYMLRAAVDPCVLGDEMLAKINALKETNTHPIPPDLKEKIKWLEGKVGGSKDDVAKVTKAWKDFVPDDELDNGINFGFDYPCDKVAEVRALVMDGMTNVCEEGKGQKRLDDIAKVRKEHNPDLDGTTLSKIKKLEARVKQEAENLAKLEKAWEDFVPDDEVEGKLDFVFEYCDKAAQIKAYTMDGTINFCAKGKSRYEDIQKTTAKHSPDLDAVTQQKVDALKARLDEADKDLADLNSAWGMFLKTPAAKDKISEEGFPKPDTTLGDQIRLVEFYCDKIAQTKAWTIEGHLDPCSAGATGLMKKIDALKKKHSLNYDSKLSCQVDKLRAKIYQCRYWELVQKAWQITYDECQRFGPTSSKIMYDDLNAGEMPCETRVSFEMLGKIGLKYTITTVLCQKINLAQMGDPEYYKKIANWVQTEVLDKYCEANMRCKKDFFIYLEGHTDGHRFGGATYDKSLNIPEGTPFTHFVGKPKGAGADTLQKTTRNITSRLESNMELGIARAWTVKQQLDFMNVPTTIGAYEHPEDEKDKDYRRIEIELNITNLMLDFFEKTLDRLVKESGIGDRPPTSC